MNRNYGKLVGSDIEYAPDKIVKDGEVISNPSAETYLTAGWKHIIDNPPAAEDGCTVQPSGWEDGEAEITRIYKQVPEPAPVVKPRVFSKLKLVTALKEANKWILVKTWIEEYGLWDYYLAAQNFREDNPMFKDAVASIKDYARISDEDAETILKDCIWEED